MVTPETVKQMVRELYGYELSDDDARAVANFSGAMEAGSRHLATLELNGIEAPFSYAAMIAEAERVAARSRK